MKDTLVKLGAIFHYDGDLLGHLAEQWSDLGVIFADIGGQLQGTLEFDQQKSYLIDMPKALSLGICAAKRLAWKTQMFSNIEIVYLMKMPKYISTVFLVQRNHSSVQTQMQKGKPESTGMLIKPMQHRQC